MGRLFSKANWGRRPPHIIDRDELLDHVDYILDCVDQVAPPHMQRNCMLVMEHLVQVELEYYGDKEGGS